jgi:hypothetical protein
LAEFVGGGIPGQVDCRHPRVRQSRAGAIDVCGRERLARKNHGIGGAPSGDVPGIGPPNNYVPRGVVLAEFAQRDRRQREKTKRFTRRLKPPARKGEQAIVGEVREVVVKSVCRVEIVFREREGAGRG